MKVLVAVMTVTLALAGVKELDSTPTSSGADNQITLQGSIREPTVVGNPTVMKVLDGSEWIVDFSKVGKGLEYSPPFDRKVLVQGYITHRKEGAETINYVQATAVTDIDAPISVAVQGKLELVEYPDPAVHPLVTVETASGLWSIVFSSNESLQKEAVRLNDRQVLVAGRPVQKPGFAIFIDASSIREATQK